MVKMRIKKNKKHNRYDNLKETDLVIFMIFVYFVKKKAFNQTSLGTLFCAIAQHISISINRLFEPTNWMYEPLISI